MQEYKVAIIGGGFCGTMVAAHLSRLAPTMPVALIERNTAVGIVAKEYRVCDSAGHPVEGLYALGNLLKGKLYATVAIREQRTQAADLAGILAK